MALTAKIKLTLATVIRSLRYLFKLRKSKQILLFCNSKLMAFHLQRFKEIFTDDGRLKFYTAFCTDDENSDEAAAMEKTLSGQKVNSSFTLLGNWDMIVVADHMDKGWMIKTDVFPTVFIGHGAQGKVNNDLLVMDNFSKADAASTRLQAAASSNLLYTGRKCRASL